MSTERDMTRIVRSWLEDGVTVLPDRVLDSVLDQLPATHQRRPRWPAWRIAEMNSYAKLAIAAAAVVVVAVAGMKFLSATNGPGAESPTPSASVTATATPQPTAVARLPEGAVDAGTYEMGSGPTFLVTVPPGWVASGGMELRKQRDEPTEVALFAWSADLNVFTDACQSGDTEEPVGPTVDDLLTALRAQANSEISDPVDVSVGGVPGIKLQVSAPAGLDISTCFIGSLQVWRAGQGGWLSGVGLNDAPADVYLADTPAGRLAFSPHTEPEASAADIAELDTIISSIRFQ